MYYVYTIKYIYIYIYILYLYIYIYLSIYLSICLSICLYDYIKYHNSMYSDWLLLNVELNVFKVKKTDNTLIIIDVALMSPLLTLTSSVFIDDFISNH